MYLELGTRSYQKHYDVIQMKVLMICTSFGEYLFGFLLASENICKKRKFDTLSDQRNGCYFCCGDENLAGAVKEGGSISQKGWGII